MELECLDESGWSMVGTADCSVVDWICREGFSAEIFSEDNLLEEVLLEEVLLTEDLLGEVIVDKAESVRGWRR